MNPLTPSDSRADSEQNPAGTSYFREPQSPTDRLRGGFTATQQPLYENSHIYEDVLPVVELTKHKYIQNTSH